jgi:uncharacterized protein (DUF1499 family)
MSDAAGKGQSLVASASAALALVGLLAMAGGAAAASLGWVPPLRGFGAFGLGLLGSLLAVPVGLLGLIATRGGRPGRSRTWLGIVGGLVGVAVAGVASAPGRGLPRINDITTDTADPPAFSAAGRAGPNQGRDLGYPGEEFAAQQRAAYPDLTPIDVPQPPAEALAEAERAARALGWEIVVVDPATGTLEANEISRLFRFVDDVVIRVRPRDGGSRIDVRSRSRDGRGDLGQNARRIRELRDELLR